MLPRRDESGAVEGGLGIAQDVTEERVYREELERQNRRLERFTRLVFHDIRNPLMVAQGRIDMLREECASDHVEPVADALDRIETLTREEPTSVIGDDSGELDPVDLGAIAEEAWRNVATKDAELRVGIDRTVRADEGDLRRMFENLYSNAVTHGGERVTVTVGELPGGFFLEDDGRGLPAEIRERAFEHGVSAAESGTGFGLFIVGNVVDAHGWTIDATEGSDGGARFEVTGLDD